MTAELERLRESDTVRVIDALAVYKAPRASSRSSTSATSAQDEAVELGTKIGALIGLGIAGEEGAEALAEAGGEAAADGIDVFGGDEWDVLEDIPPNTAAALILIEHQRGSMFGLRRVAHWAAHGTPRRAAALKKTGGGRRGGRGGRPTRGGRRSSRQGEASHRA